MENEAGPIGEGSPIIRKHHWAGKVKVRWFALELAIEQDKLHTEPVDISDLYAVEIDFAEDLERANLYV